MVCDINQLCRLLNPDWYVISRTILPVMFSQNDLFPGSGSQSGLRDTTEGLYFSPSRTFNGFPWEWGQSFGRPQPMSCSAPGNGAGVRPGSCLAGQWLDGGILARHIWSFTGGADRAISTKLTCSPSSPIQHPRRGRLRFRAKVLTTGRLANG